MLHNVYQPTFGECTMSTTAAQTYAFQAEINQLLSLIINAFYSNKEIFLRELISNASDAIDKIRYLSLTDNKQLAADPALEIRIRFDKDNGVLVIEDTGIGMTRDDLINCLGTIAKSGTKAFMEAVASGNADTNLIGQFGVGFYSAYLVSDKVTVMTKHNDDAALVWESNAGGSFTISPLPDGATPLARGTRILLHLKEDQRDALLSEAKIKEIVKKHSQFINYPIKLEVIKEIEKEVEVDEDTEAEVETQTNTKTEPNNEEGKVEDDDTENSDAKKKTKSIKETVKEDELLNSEKPLWLRKADDVTEDDHNKFYKVLTGEIVEPLAWKHFAVEGGVEFKALIYIPKHAPTNVLSHAQKPNNIKLYVKRVFIMDDCEQLVPDYLRFVKGVVDSDDLPLNVSREMLQQSSVLNIIKKNLTKHVLSALADMKQNDGEKYKLFYEQFNKHLKLGINDDAKNREKIADLLYFDTTHKDAEGQCLQTTLQEYLDRMKPEQSKIYYLAGENLPVLKNSPFLEVLKEKGYEVLLLHDPIDEFMMQNFRTYKDKEFVNCQRDGALKDIVDEKETEQVRKSYEGVCTKIKDLLGDKVMKVKASNRLKDTPCVLVSDDWGWSANMERIMKAQALSETNQMHKYMAGRKTLELNPENKIIKEIKRRFDNGQWEKGTEDLVRLLFESAVLDSGYAIENPTTFVKRIHRMIQVGLTLDEDNEESDNAVSVTQIIDVGSNNETDEANPLDALD